MTEQNSEKNDCCKCSCGNSKSSNLLLSFMLLVIILLLSGIFYSIQGAIAMCPVMKSSKMCHIPKDKMAPCPMMGKTYENPAK